MMDSPDRAALISAGAAFLAGAVCAFVPGPRMYVRDNLRYIAGNWYKQPNPSGRAATKLTYSPGILNPDTWTAPTRYSQLGAAIEKNHRELTTGVSETPALMSLESYCD